MDVAHAAQVSRQTVSNVVNNPERVAPNTLKRVHRDIQRLRFRPSVAARSLQQQRANAVGIELNSTGAGTIGSVLDAFLVVLAIASRQHDSHLVPFAAADRGQPLPAYEDLLASQLVDAFVLTDTRRDDPRPAWLMERDVPFASFGRTWDNPTFSRWVDVDGAAGVSAGVNHLLEQGYERVGFLGWPAGSPVGDDRRSGWVAAARAASRFEPAWQAEAENSLGAAAAGAAALVDAIGRGGAVVCASDTLAMGVWMALRDRGLVPGADFGVVGFGDTDLAESFGLTSLRQPLHDAAECILQMLEAIRLEEATSHSSEGTLFRPTITPRSSSHRSRLTSSPTSTGDTAARPHQPVEETDD